MALEIKYKISNAYICNQGYCFKNSFILVRDISQEVILSTPFITQIYLFKVDQISMHTEMWEQQYHSNLSPLFIKKIYLYYKIPQNQDKSM